MSGGSLKDQRIVIYGAGSAGMGIADQIKDGLMILDGLDKNEAARRFWCVDRNGLLVESMGNALRHAQMAYARPDEEVREWRRENEGQDAIRLLDGKSGCIEYNASKKRDKYLVVIDKDLSGQVLIASYSRSQADRPHWDLYSHARVQRGD